MKPLPPDILYGRRPVQLFLEKSPRKPRRLLIDRRLSGDVLEKFTRLGRGRSVAATAIDSGLLDRLTDGGVHQGVALEADPLRIRDEGDIAKTLSTRAKNASMAFLALDSVTDPQNFGAILRTADAFGMSGVIFEARHAPPLGGAAYKASAGALEFVPLYGVGALSSALRTVKHKGGVVLGLDSKGNCALDSCRDAIASHSACVFVLGSEGRGMQPQVRSVCDRLCSIPMHGHVGSLNVSAAAAVVCFWGQTLTLPLFDKSKNAPTG